MDVLERRLTTQGDKAVVAASFYGVENRFGHEIRLELKNGIFVLRTDDRITGNWPPCPPIQDIHFESRDDGDVLFGVGMAGKTHYSLSIVAGEHQMKFEFAANVKDLPEHLGTTYLITENTIPESEIALEEVIGLLPETESTNSDEKRSFGPSPTQTFRPPTTIQWGFTLNP